MALVNNNSMVPDRISSASRRMVSAGMKKKEGPVSNGEKSSQAGLANHENVTAKQPCEKTAEAQKQHQHDIGHQRIEE